MQVIIIITIILSYLFLVSQYNAAANNGARDIAAALSKRSFLQLLNKRTFITTPLLILSTALCSFNNKNIFLQFHWNGKNALTTILLLFVCLFVSIYSGLQFRDKLIRTISIQESIGYLSLRIPGLVVYEIFFRGVLLGISLERISIPAAIAFNIIFYALAHAFGSRKEFIGSIPFGLLLCYITIVSQSVLPAVLLHLSLAVPYESILLNQSQSLTKKIGL